MANTIQLQATPLREACANQTTTPPTFNVAAAAADPNHARCHTVCKLSFCLMVLWLALISLQKLKAFTLEPF